MIDSDLGMKMDSGVLYDPADPSLLKYQKERLHLLQLFNSLDAQDMQKREEMQKELFASVGSSVYIELPFYANWAGLKVHIGSNVYINFLCVMVDDAPIYIGDRVMIGPRVTLCTATHPLEPELRTRGLQYNREIHIEDDVWVGAGAYIGPGITIGCGSVIGAGSVVTHDIPEGVVAYGVPARVMKKISTESCEEKL